MDTNTKKWSPCYCSIVIGILVIVFAWLKVAWAPIALTVLGAVTVIGGLVNKCCCKSKGEGASCC